MWKARKKQIGLEHQTHVYLTPEIKADLQKRAEAADRSVTAEIRRAIKFYLENSPTA